MSADRPKFDAAKEAERIAGRLPYEDTSSAEKALRKFGQRAYAQAIEDAARVLEDHGCRRLNEADRLARRGDDDLGDYVSARVNAAQSAALEAAETEIRSLLPAKEPT